MRGTSAAALGIILSASVFAQDWARQELEKSPRHQEWVVVKQDGHAVRAFLVYPEVQQKAPAVVVIHENMGLTDWVRSVADQLATHGYIAIAPDLLSGMAPTGGGTSGRDDRRVKPEWNGVPSDKRRASDGD